jgi:short-subunit dehydrogenase involved in D-alanine esterification of teichoic acids
MANVSLVVGKETYVGLKLAEKLTQTGRNVVTFGSDGAKQIKNIAWNRGGYISTVTAVRELIRQHGVPVEVFVVFGRKRDESFPLEPASVIDEVIDLELKALLYLTQELYKRIVESPTETAIYFVGDRLDDFKKPLSMVAASGFRSYARTLMNMSGTPYLVGCELSTDDEEPFIEYVVKMADEPQEKRRNSWIIYPKPSLFGMRSK